MTDDEIEYIKQSIHEYKNAAVYKHSDDWSNAIDRACDLLMDCIYDGYIQPDDQIDKYTIEQIYAYIMDNYDFSDRYIINILSILRNVMIRADAKGLDTIIDDSNARSIYATDLNLNRSNRHEREFTNGIYIEKEDHDKVMDACQNLRDILILRFLWQTGLRPAELSNLKIGDLGDSNLSVNVQTKKQRDTKIRQIPFKSNLKLNLRKWIVGGIKESYGPDSEYIINTQRSEKMEANQINKRVQKLIQYSDLQNDYYEKEVTNNNSFDGRETVTRKYKRYTAKSWRHGFAMRAISKGMPLPFLSYLMGHASVDITEEKYLDIDSDDAEEAYRKYI